METSFFKNLGPININHIKEHLKCVTHNISDNDYFVEFTDLKKLKKNGLSFITDNNFSNDHIYNYGTLICSKSTYKKFKGPNPIIEVDDVNNAVAIISNLFYRSLSTDEIESLDNPEINIDCIISKNAVIERGAIIGKNVKVSSGCFIGNNCIIGDNTIIDCNTVITNSIVAENVKIGRNASIGQQGFGFAINNNKNINIFHCGRVIIQSGVSIGSNCTIDRGSFSDTIIGSNTFFDNMCHIAHNVTVGKNCIFAAMSGIAGSTKIGDNVMAGGQTGIAGHLCIGSNVQIAAQSGVLNNLKDNSIVMGHPAINKFTFIKKFKKNYA